MKTYLQSPLSCLSSGCSIMIIAHFQVCHVWIVPPLLDWRTSFRLLQEKKKLKLNTIIQ